MLLDQEIADELPYNDYLGYYGPDYRLHLQPSNMENLNTPEILDGIYQKVVENLRHLPCAPNVQLTGDHPNRLLDDSDESDNEVFDERLTTKFITTRIKMNVPGPFATDEEQ